jgi:RHS repeat-associated protein
LIYSSEYGRVTYTHGLALDRPLKIHRQFFARDSTDFTNVYVYPHYTWRGEPAGHTTTESTNPAFANTVWPVQGARAFGELLKSTLKGWFGSQILDRQEESGLQYMRNRYYNPTTGRFTQEDPIGLAGGLNLYGFAAGDPVNFSDPFGLCPPAWACDLAVAAGMWATTHPKGAAAIEYFANNFADGMSVWSGGMCGGGEGCREGLIIGAATFFITRGEVSVPRRFQGPKPTHIVNEAHIPGKPGFHPGKPPLPNDAKAVFKNAVPNDPQNPTAWFGKNADGAIYRFSVDRNNQAHFSGIDGVGDGVRNLTPYARARLNQLP